MKDSRPGSYECAVPEDSKISGTPFARTETVVMVVFAVASREAMDVGAKKAEDLLTFLENSL
jgi:hypothetical protein